LLIHRQAADRRPGRRGRSVQCGSDGRRPVEPGLPRTWRFRPSVRPSPALTRGSPCPVAWWRSRSPPSAAV